jgi:hypothetical protein
MALDRALSNALREATREAGQADTVASRLLAWLTRLSDEELSREAGAKFYDEVRAELKVDGAGDAD